MKDAFTKKRIVIGLVILAALITLFVIFKNTNNQQPPNPIGSIDSTESVKSDYEQTDTGVIIEWLNFGIDYPSIRFEDAGEGLYTLEALTEDNTTKYGFMNGTGDLKIPIIYDNAKVFSDGMSYVELGEKKLFIDPSGKEVLDVSEYSNVSSFEFGFSVVTRVHSEAIESGFRQSFLQGLIDKSGNEVLPCVYYEAGCFENGIIWAVQNGKFQIFSSSGNKLTQNEYNYVAYADEDMMIAEKDGKVGYLNKNGEVSIPFEYDHANRFINGLALVGKDGLKGYINVRGEAITDIEFEDANDFSEERAAVKVDGYYGYIDTQGNMVIPNEYDEVYSFNNGIAVVIKNIGRRSSYTPIDKNGEIAIIPNEMGYYKWNDRYIAYYNPEMGDYEVDLDFLALLDNSGIRLTEFYYTNIFDFQEGIAVAQESGGFSLFYGLINQHGVEIIPLFYENLAIVNSNTCIVQKYELDAETGSENRKVGIATLPEDAATRRG